jgi:hypothetical protein
MILVSLTGVPFPTICLELEVLNAVDHWMCIQ